MATQARVFGILCQEDSGVSPVEHKLNRAIADARIDRGFEEYLEILNTFYSDDVEFSIAGHPQLIRDKARVASFLRGILVPLHVLAEIGCLTISVRHTAIPGDTTKQANFSWRVDLCRSVRNDRYCHLVHVSEMERPQGGIGAPLQL